MIGNKVQSNSYANKAVISLILISLIPFTSFAEQVPKKRSAWEEYLIKSNIAISEMVDRMAESIDSFLVKKESERENETSIRIENISTSTEGEYVINATHLNINLRLPNVEDYFQLKFTTYDQNEDRGSQKKYGTPVSRPQNYGATVGLFKNLGSIKTSFQPRIELQDPLKVSHSLTFETSAKMPSYEFKPKLEFFANPDKGTGTFGAINFAFFLNEKYTLNWINEGEYQEKLNQFSTNLGTSLVQGVNEKAVLAYSLFFNANNRPVYHLQSYTFSVSWNHVLYNKIFDYQIVPHLVFSTTRNFKGVVGITLVLNLNF